MKLAPLLLCLLLPACISNARLEHINADLCAHSRQVTLFADAMISAAGHLSDPVLQKAQIDAANAMLATVAACPATATAQEAPDV
jgi:hypothetical protein